jgi:hypothetical protein
LSIRRVYGLRKKMGLSVHFKLAASADTDAVRARELVQAMRRRAQGFKRRGRVDDVLPIGDDAAALRWAIEYQSIPVPGERGCYEGVVVPAEAGYIFPVVVGKDCEPLWLGLCRYPKTVLLATRRCRTHLPGWRLSGFSKTQYASLHGWEHFRRCHTAVVDLLHGMRGLGLAVEINDEADYWPGRSLAVLRKNLEQMNGAVAALAGALKDGDENTDHGARVESPIFHHPQFERLEAEGAEKMSDTLRNAREETSRLRP